MRVDVFYSQTPFTSVELSSARETVALCCEVADELFGDLLLGILFMITRVNIVPELGRLCSGNFFLIV